MKRIDELFKELSEIIPEIKENTNEWKVFLEEFISQRPDSKIDTHFKNELKQLIINNMNKKFIQESNSPSSAATIWKGLIGLVASLAVISIVAFPALNGVRNSLNQSQKGLSDQNKGISSVDPININQLDGKAFGALDMNANSTNSASVTRPQGGGGGGGDMAVKNMIYPIGRTNFFYEYVGQPVEDLPNQSTVYRKKFGETVGLSSDIAPLIEKMGLNALDLTKLNPLGLRQISLAQTKEEIPYIINIDYYYGNISVNVDYDLWQKKICPSGFCEYKAIKKEEIPGDAELIGIAKAFVDQFGISLKNTGSPEVQKYWENPMLMQSGQKQPEPEYYPEGLNVIFPILIEGNPVKEGYDSIGVNVFVDLRHKKVTSATIPLFNLESSNYSVKNSEVLLDMASKGGYTATQYNSPDRVVKLKIDTPKKELRRIWRQKDGRSEELYLEMMVFPVIREDANASSYADYFISNEVLVPLADTL